MTVQGERNEAGAPQDSGTANGGADTVGEAHGGSGRKLSGVAVLSRKLGQIQVPVDSSADVRAHRLWNRGTTAMFNIQIINLNSGSYLRMAL